MSASWIIRVCLFLIFYSNAICFAGSYFISSSGGKGSGSIADPWSLSHANSTLKAGDIAIMRGGTYVDIPIAPANSGSGPSNQITYKNYNDERVIIKGKSSGSLSRAINLERRSYITVDGIEADGGPGVFEKATITRMVIFYNATNNTIKNCRLTFAKGWGSLDFKEGGGNYNKILNNYIAYTGMWVDFSNSEDVGSTIYMPLNKINDYNLIKGNTFYRAGHDIFKLSGSHNIIVDNLFDNSWGVYEGAALDSAGDIKTGDTVGNRWGELLGTRNVIRNNIFRNSPESVDSAYVSALKAVGRHNIIRNNIFYNTNGPALLGTTSGTNPKGKFNRIFNNTFYAIGGALLYVNQSTGSFDAPEGTHFVNNIAWKTRLAPNPKRSRFDVEIMLHGLKTHYGDEILNNEFKSNCMPYNSYVYSDVQGRKILDHFEREFPDNFSDNIQADPMFVAVEPEAKFSDMSLKKGSPCIDAAKNLAVTKASGSGVTVSVSDASYFYDGFGIDSADMIIVGKNNPVKIVSIDYSSNVVKVSSSIEWLKGDAVNLIYSGASPDIGAVEFLSNSLAPPLPPDHLNIQADK